MKRTAAMTGFLMFLMRFKGAKRLSAEEIEIHMKSENLHTF
tara:strand:- start:70 stop:192 length:123 start_codon:yes stop_codon:yes gene_type:complete